MEENPFQAIIEVMRREGAPRSEPAFVLGQVQSLSPLQVLVEGTLQTRESLLADARLLAGAELAADCQAGGQGSIEDADGRIAGSAEFRGSLVLRRREAAWSVGDQLLMLAIEERQRYIILCKVVSL